MTGTTIEGEGLGGVLRLTWNTDHLAHVLAHCQADEPTGAWTGLACPDHGLALGADVDNAALRQLSAHSDIADLLWEPHAELIAEHDQLCRAAIQAHLAGARETGERLWQQAEALWSLAWSANYQALGLLQKTGLARFAMVRPQRWVIASYEHHCGPHGLPHPHIHNIVVTALVSGIASDASLGSSCERRLPAPQRSGLGLIRLVACSRHAADLGVRALGCGGCQDVASDPVASGVHLVAFGA